MELLIFYWSRSSTNHVVDNFDFIPYNYCHSRHMMCSHRFRWLLYLLISCTLNKSKYHPSPIYFSTSPILSLSWDQISVDLSAVPHLPTPAPADWACVMSSLCRVSDRRKLPVLLQQIHIVKVWFHCYQRQVLMVLMVRETPSTHSLDLPRWMLTRRSLSCWFIMVVALWVLVLAWWWHSSWREIFEKLNSIPRLGGKLLKSWIRSWRETFEKLNSDLLGQSE